MPDIFLGSPEHEWFEATTPQQASLLTRQKSLYHYAPFMGRELGVAEAARRAGVSTERMMYWKEKFLAAGLLTQVGTKRESRGRPVPLFSAPKALKVPFHLTSYEDVSAQLAELGQFYEELRVRATARLRSGSGQLCHLIYRDEENGTLNLETQHSDSPQEIEMNFAGTLWLPEGAARELEAQCKALCKLLERYATPHEDAKPYLFSTAFVTLDLQEDAWWLRDFTLPEDQQSTSEVTGDS